MNLNELNKIVIKVTAQPQKDETRIFKLVDFPSVKDINYYDETIKAQNEQEQNIIIKKWEFIIKGKWQPIDNKTEFESDVQELRVSGIDNETANPENSWSLCALAFQKGNGLALITPRIVFFREIKNAEDKRAQEQSEKQSKKEYEKIVACYDTDIVPFVEQ